MLLFLLIPLVLGEPIRINLAEHDIYKAGPLSIAADGTFCYAEAGGQTLIFFNALGDLITRVEKEGQGPGEFKRIVAVHWVPGANRFYVGDATRGRVLLWKTDGHFDREFAMPTFKDKMMFTAEDQVLGIEDFEGLKGSTPSLVASAANGEKRILYQHPPLERTYGLHANEPDLKIYYKFAWDAEMTFALGADFLAVNFTDENKVHLLAVGGKERGEITLRLPRPELTKDHRDLAMARFPKGWREKVAAIWKPPEFWPMVARLLVDEGNRIWLFGVQASPNELVPYQIFDSKGDMLADGKLPSTPLAVHNRYAWLLYDEDDRLMLQQTQALINK